jgi:hypothetical protein
MFLWKCQEKSQAGNVPRGTIDYQLFTRPLHGVNSISRARAIFYSIGLFFPESSKIHRKIYYFREVVGKIHRVWLSIFPVSFPVFAGF